jgi:hypothetical protein
MLTAGRPVPKPPEEKEENGYIDIQALRERLKAEGKLDAMDTASPPPPANSESL